MPDFVAAILGKLMEILYDANQTAIDLDNMIKAIYWVSMITAGGFAIYYLRWIAHSLALLAAVGVGP